MVAYLQKPEGSEGIHQIVYFLNTSHIRYALTENPTIYVSLIQQFWQTATASTLDNGEMEITATIDGKVKVVTEASVRRHLKLEYSDGISNLPTTEIFEQLALMGNIATALICLATNRKFNFSKLIFDGMDERSIVPFESRHTPTGAPLTSRPHLSPTPRSSIRQETEVPQSSSPPHTDVVYEAASTGMGVRHRGAATTITSLDAGQGSGNINKTLSMPHDSPLLRVHTLGSVEGRMQHNELMDLVIKLLDRVVALETDLKQTKKVYGVAYTKLIMKLKKLEKTVKTRQARRRAKIVISDDEEDLEDPSKQGRKIDEIDQDPNIALIQHNAEIQGRYDQDMEFNLNFDAAKEFSTTKKEVSTAEPVSTVGAAVTTASVDVSPISPTRRVSTSYAITMAETLVYIRRSAAKDKGKRIMSESEPVQTKTKLQQEQEILGYEQLRGYSFDKLKTLFEITMRRVNTFVPIKSEVDRAVLEFATRSLNRDAEEELDQGSSKRKKTVESSELAEAPRDKDANESEYPLSRGVLTQILGVKLLMKQDNKMFKELLRKIFMQFGIHSLGGYDWSDQAEDGLTSFALMGYSSTSSNSEASADKPKEVRKNFDPSLIKDWKSDSEDEAELKPNIEKKTVKPSFAKIKPKAVVNAVLGNRVNDVKASACWVWKPKTKVIEHVSKHNSASITLKKFDYVKAQGRSKSDKGVIDSGCSSHMTRSMSYLTDYDEIDEGYVPFGGNPKRGKITSKGTISTGIWDFEKVYFITNESQVLLRVPRKNNMCIVDLKNIVPKEGLTCLFAKATSDESKLLHRRLGPLNFKTMNKWVKRNLVRGLPSKLFENNQDYVVCQKGKQHKASCKSKTENSVSLPLHLLHMDLFGPTFVKSLMKKMYFLVVADDFSSPTPTIRIHKDHPLDQVIGDLHLTTQTRHMSKNLEEHGFVTTIHQRTNDKDLQNCLFACFLSQEEPKKKQDGVFISWDKYVAEILKKYGFLEVKNASTLMETQKPLLKDEDVCACARYKVNLKVSYLHAVKRIFRYLKGQPKFGLWYPKDSPFNLVAYTDSDYAGASLDR
nr:hypothetical protein [Tanacetum cinerariifolium]